MENIKQSHPVAHYFAAKKPVIREYAKSILVALILAFAIRTLIIQPFKIPSGSMEDTLAVGDHILVSKFIYGTRIPFTDKKVLRLDSPKRGDIVVFTYPVDASKDFIKRVVGVPGDEIVIRNKKVYINGKPYEDPHEVHREKDTVVDVRDNFGPVRVPDRSYFVMGDNRDRSYDSRFWGFVGEEKLRGKAFIKYWSWDADNATVRWKNIGKLIE